MGAHRWQWEAGCLLAAALVTTVVFATGTLDIAAARWFFRPDAADHWPLAREFPWLILYRAASWITAALILVGLAGFALSFTRRGRQWRGAATLVLLAVAVGPGLIGNAVLKDHWKHPRPRDLIELGGSLLYVPSPLVGHEGGASFPCGHCTVGFLFGIGWWIFRRSHPRLATVSLAAGLMIGALLGIGRMAAGAHFLSDVIWSALLACGVTHILYYHVLRLEAAGAAATASIAEGPPRWPRALNIAAPIAGVIVLLALSVLPHGSDLSASVALTSRTPRILEVGADRANIAVVLVDSPATRLAIEGELHGFGLPGSRLEARLETVAGPAPALRYAIVARGWLTDVDGFARLTMPASAFARIRVRVGQGDIDVLDATQSGVVSSGAVQLDLHTGRGTVHSSSAKASLR
jgi:membrane-associated PAP2 superfamily phosphatase